MLRRASKRLSFAAGAFLLPLSSQAVAQTAPDPPVVISPLKVEPERNAVNLTTGKIDLDVPSLGVPGAPRLHFDKVQNSAPYMRGTIVATGGTSNASYSVTTTGGSSESFKCLDFDCDSITKSGSTFVSTGIHHQNGQYSRAGSGEIYHFTLVSADSAAGNTRTVQAYASKINYADGEIVTFTYDSAVCGLGTCYRPNRIETNVGYFITVTYQSNDITNLGWAARRWRSSLPPAPPAHRSRASPTAGRPSPTSADACGTSLAQITRSAARLKSLGEPSSYRPKAPIPSISPRRPTPH
jgi:hypothetical protein